jgi:hypothetical protein
MPQTKGASTTLVASSRPPSPTSSTKASAGVREKARKAAGRLEEAQFHLARRLKDLGKQPRQLLVLDQPPGKADALVEADEVRAGIGMDLEPRRLQRRAQEGTGRALAVGAGDMQHRREGAMRIAELSEQIGNPLKPQYVAPRRQARQPVELGLDEGVIGAGAVRHAGP